MLKSLMESALVPVEYRETSTRIRVGMMRKSYNNVWKNLTPDMKTACEQIEVGFNCIAGSLGFPSGEYSDTKGGSVENFQDWSLNMSDKVRKWRNESDSKHTDVVIDFVVHGISFKQMGVSKQRTRQTISTYFYQGLTDYCDIHFS